MTKAIAINKEILKSLGVNTEGMTITSVTIKLKGHDYPIVTIKQFHHELGKFKNTAYEIKEFEKKGVPNE